MAEQRSPKSKTGVQSLPLVPRREKLHNLNIGDRVRTTKEYLKSYKHLKDHHNYDMEGVVVGMPFNSSMTVSVKFDCRKSITRLHYSYLEKIG